MTVSFGSNLALLLALSYLLAPTAHSSRDLPAVTSTTTTTLANSSAGHELTLDQRLFLSFDGAGECWNAMFQLRSCTNEIILFFVNGESYLGQDCCRAIRVITRQCWPSMLTSVGFTAEEGDILRGYCDAGASGGGIAAPPTACPPPVGGPPAASDVPSA